jgi:aryl-phospho-beta-D-glucosidase BglC (GH1 family)
MQHPVFGRPVRPTMPDRAQDIVKDGIWFKDPSGRYLLVRGVNFGARSKLSPFLPVFPVSFPTSADPFATLQNELKAVGPQLDLMRTLGFNAVRIPVMWAALEPSPLASVPGPLAQEGQRYLRLLRNVIDEIWKRGIYVFLDFHQDIASEIFGGDGFPLWAVQNEPGLDIPSRVPAPNKRWGAAYAVNKGVRATLQAFWKNKLRNDSHGLRDFPVQDHFINAIAETARFFRGETQSGHPAILGYEVFNEPHDAGLGAEWSVDSDGSSWRPFGREVATEVFDKNVLTPFYAAVERAIRPIDPDAFLFVEPRVDWTSYPADHHVIDLGFDVTKPETFLGTQGINPGKTVFAFHFYDPWTIRFATASRPHGDDMGNKAEEWPQAFAKIKQAAADRNWIPFATELGAGQDWDFETSLRPALYRNNQTRAYIDLSYRQIENHLLNVTYWNYDLYNTAQNYDNWNFEDFSLLGPGREPRNIDLVARPYPMRSAAKPTLAQFDAETKRFSLKLSGATVHAPTVIYIPRNLHFEAGFFLRANAGTFHFNAATNLLEWTLPVTDSAGALYKLEIRRPGDFSGDGFQQLPSRAKVDAFGALVNLPTVDEVPELVEI